MWGEVYQLTAGSSMFPEFWFHNCRSFYMAARAIWKGELKVGSTAVPVKVYAGVQDRGVHFHVVQSKSKTRVKQEMVTEDHQHLGKADIRKGYEVEPGSFVILSEEELQSLKPKESRAIAFSRFVPPAALGNEWYERPYYLGPDGDETEYFALAEALANQELIGIVRWSMRGKSYVGALRAEGHYLVLIKLRYSQEVLSDRELPAPEGRPLAQNEFRMAEELVAALEGSFDPKEFRDEYRERLQNFIEAKARGKSTRLPVIKERTTAASLDQQLAKSLAAMKRTGKEKTGKEKKVA
jgi:DNA end-binding protein Ku